MNPVRPSHSPLTDDESAMLDADAQLSQIMQDAIQNKDLETLADAIGEKRSIERALGESRWETFNRHMDREFFGGGS